jgi:hypothetical protein
MSVIISTTIGNIALKEMYEAYEAGVELVGGPYVQKTYLCPSWASAFPVVNALMGAGRTPQPHRCPESNNLVCVDARVLPRAEADIRDSGRPAFNLPVVQARYQIRSWEAQTTDNADNSFPNEIAAGQPYVYMEESIDFDTELIKMPNRLFAFADGVAIDEPIARSIAVATFTMVRKWQQVLPHVKLTKYLNTLNDKAFLGQERGHIKFRRCRTRRQYTSDGTTSQEVEYQFQWREFSHNTLIRPDTGLFAPVYQDGDATNGPTIYPYSDLTQLLV